MCRAVTDRLKRDGCIADCRKRHRSSGTSGRSDVDGDEPHRPLDEVQDHVVGANDLAAVDVDDLPVEQVALQEGGLLAEEAAAYFESEYDTAFDVWDLRALAPLRLDEIRASLARTGRLIVLHEGRRTHGFGAELVARLTEENFTSLKAPPLRIAALDLPVPFAPELERAYRPTLEAVIDRVAAWMG